MWVAIALGGACGGLARVAIEQTWPVGDGWPWATFAANLTGAALLAHVVGRAGRRPPGLALPLVGTGLCGGLTTFATLQVELIGLLEAGRPGLAAGYLGASLAGGAAAAAASLRLTRRRGG